MEPKSNTHDESYRQIIDSTAIIGGSSGINIILRIVRTKFLAILLGPSGIGLLGIYNSITEIVRTTAGMGINSSGVRQIAQAVGTGNIEQIARTSFTLGRLSFCLGALGMALLVVLSFPICHLAFNNTEYASDIMLLSFIVLFEIVMNGKVAMIQGMRRIGDLAKLNVLSALFGTILSVPIVYVWGQKGIVPFLIAASAMSILTAWWYSRKLNVPHVQISWVDMWSEVKPLLKLGSAIMGSGLMSVGTMFLVRVLVARQFGLDGVGLYQAAITLSAIYVGFIIDSMVKDYLPRLTAVADQDAACNRLVNQQVEIGILIALPGILATLTFAPLILQLFYSSKFMAAFEILRWQVLGSFLQVAIAPISLILQAKGLGKMFLLTNGVTNIVHVCLIWAAMSYFGLNGTGMAFFGKHAFYWIFIYCVAMHLTGFNWSGANIRIALWALPAIGIVFVSGSFLEHGLSLIVGSTITIAVALYSVKSLVGTIGPGGFVSNLVTIKHRLWSSIAR